MAASISASVDEVGVTSRLRGSVGARAGEYRRAELKPMVARAAFKMPSTGGSLEKPTLVGQVRWRETWQGRRGRIGHDSTGRLDLSPYAWALPPRMSEKSVRTIKSVNKSALLSFGRIAEPCPKTDLFGQRQRPPLVVRVADL